MARPRLSAVAGESLDYPPPNCRYHPFMHGVNRVVVYSTGRPPKILVMCASCTEVARSKGHVVVKPIG